MYGDGMGIVSLDPPCTRKARYGEFGEKLPCTPCHEVPHNPPMCKWMREECNADSGTPHFKLGVLKLAKRANAHRADKRIAISTLRRVSSGRFVQPSENDEQRQKLHGCPAGIALRPCCVGC